MITQFLSNMVENWWIFAIVIVLIFIFDYWILTRVKYIHRRIDHNRAILEIDGIEYYVFWEYEPPEPSTGYYGFGPDIIDIRLYNKPNMPVIFNSIDEETKTREKIQKIIYEKIIENN
jgi:hypothetical protein